jgi:Protein of unknown function (DUF664)
MRRVPSTGGEKENLQVSLDRHRGVVLWKLEGLDDEQLRQPMVPSGTSVLGLVKHLASSSTDGSVRPSAATPNTWSRKPPGTPATWTSFASSSTEASVITAHTDNRLIARTAAGRRAPAVPVPGTRGRSARSR